MTISVGQIAQIIDSSNFTQTISFGALPATASRVLVLGNSDTTTTGTVALSDNQSGNTYTNRFNTVQSGSTIFASDCASITAPSGTFTASATGLPGYDMGMLEIDGTTAYYAACTATTGGTVSTSFAASVTAAAPTSVANSIVVAMMWMESFGGSGYTVGWNTPAGFTNASILNTGVGRIGRIDYQILTSVSTPVANWGSALTGAGSTGGWNSAIFVFSGAAPTNSAVIAWVS